MAAFAVAVTGGVAAGKSAVCRLFEAHSVAVADADIVAREIVAAGEPALAEIVARFGADMLLADGQLDRASLRRRIFSDPSARRDLDAITHPRIRERLQSQCRQAAGDYVVVAVPLLAEAGGRAAYAWIRRVLVVDAPPALQLSRLQRRDGIGAELAERMLQAQASRAERLRLADDVIVNDGTPDRLTEAVIRLDALYRQLARSA